MASKRARGEASGSGSGSGVGSGAQSLRPPYQINLPISEHRRKMAELDRREFKPTLFYCPFTCEAMGITEQVIQYAHNLGFDGFLDCRMSNDWVTNDPTFSNPSQPPLTYRHLILEFLSSFELRRSQETEGIEGIGVRFRLFNNSRNISLRELNEIFNWDPNAQLIDVPPEPVDGYDEQAWWRRITDGSRGFLSNSSKASEIHHAALRYFHRMLVFCFFSRQELGKMSSVELYLLWQATEGTAHYPPTSAANKVNLGYLFALRCKTLRDDPRMSGPIILGGLVTWVAAHYQYKVELQQLVPESYWSFLNEDRIRQMKFISLASTSPDHLYIWKVRELPWCYLPSNYMRNPPEGTENPWRVPLGDLDPEELSVNEISRREHLRAGRQQQQQQQQQVQFPMGMPPLHPSTMEGGTSSSSSSFNIEQAFANLSLQINTLAQGQYGSSVHDDSSSHSIYQSQIYDYHVDQGHIRPFVNYPYHPPQLGPIPNWEPVRTDENDQPIPRTGATYPYWQGPGTLYNPPRSFPPYNYTLPGGCDYRGDPNYPHPSFPPGYHGGWEPYGPPTQLGYKWNPVHPNDPLGDPDEEEEEDEMEEE